MRSSKCGKEPDQQRDWEHPASGMKAVLPQSAAVWLLDKASRELAALAGLIPCNPDVCQQELESSRQERTELW